MPQSIQRLPSYEDQTAMDLAAAKERVKKEQFKKSISAKVLESMMNNYTPGAITPEFEALHSRTGWGPVKETLNQFLENLKNNNVRSYFKGYFLDKEGDIYNLIDGTHLKTLEKSGIVPPIHAGNNDNVLSKALYEKGLIRGRWGPYSTNLEIVGEPTLAQKKILPHIFEDAAQKSKLDSRYTTGLDLMKDPDSWMSGMSSFGKDARKEYNRLLNFFDPKYDMIKKISERLAAEYKKGH